MEVKDVRFSNVHIDTVMPGKREWLPPAVPEVEKAYPQSRMFGWLPASGLNCRHVVVCTCMVSPLPRLRTSGATP